MKRISFGQRLIMIRQHFGINLSTFADSLKIVKSNLSRYERNLNKPTISFLSALTKTYNINLNWLFGVEKNMFLLDKALAQTNLMSNNKKSDVNKADIKVIDLNSIDYTASGIPIFKDSISKRAEKYLLPISGAISAGEPLEIQQTANDFSPLPIYKSKKNLDEYVVFRVNGLSMAPEINHEDLVFIYKNDNWIELNNKIVAVRIQGETTLKKLAINNNSKEIIFKALNKDYSDINISYEMMDATTLIGELKAIRRVYLNKNIQ